MEHIRLDLRNWDDVERELSYLPTEKTSKNALNRFMIYYEFLANEPSWDYTIPQKKKIKLREKALKMCENLKELYYELLAKENNISSEKTK